MDETFIRTASRLFSGAELPNARSLIEAELRRRVGAAEDDALLEADADAWAVGMSEELRLEPPSADIESAALKPGRRVKVDCTNAAGISYSPATQYGNVIRDGYEIELLVPVAGDAYLLATQSIGGPPMPGSIRGNAVVCEWNWPEVKGSSAFETEVTTYKNEFRRGVEVVARAVAEANAAILTFAAELIETRRSEILAERNFLGALTIPIVKDEEEPRSFEAPPPIKRRTTPARTIGAEVEEPPARQIGPRLDEFYGHILSVVRSVGRGLERSPGSFTDADEEALRDHMLVTLNTHYIGATYAEAFNGSGKTDILIRVYDRNAFIGECKWWTGQQAMDEALDQLIGYATWQDSRAALIFYVRNQGMTETIETAKSKLAEREEFIEWLKAQNELEARCRIRWPDDPDRVATFAAVFVHLPPQD